MKINLQATCFHIHKCLFNKTVLIKSLFAVIHLYGVLDFSFNPILILSLLDMMSAGVSLYFDKIDLNGMHKIRFLCNLYVNHFFHLEVRVDWVHVIL